jgi:peptide/nickel transport system substrate-binding protein
MGSVSVVARRRRSIRTTIGVVLVAGLLAACGGSSGGDSGGGSGGGGSGRDIVVLRDMDLSTLDPHRMWCDTCMIVLSGVYERLVNVDPVDPTKLLPGLATTWSANADSTEFTFTLDPKATFADGSPVTSADVKWSFERSANMAAGGSFLLTGLKQVDTPDPGTAVVIFEKPNAPFLKIAGAALALSIANSKVLTEQAKAQTGPGSDADPADSWFAEGRSAGSGPYVIESYTTDQSIVLKRNDNYWGTKAPFASITFKEVTDSASQLLQMQSGDADMAMNIAFDSVDEVEKIDGVDATALDSFNFIHLNLNHYAPGGEDLADAKVRQAIRYAIDYDKLIEATLAGNGRVQATAIPNGFPGTEGLELPKRDLDKAKQLMADAGKADGFSIEAQYFKANVYGVDFDTMMQRIQQDLKDINIDLQLKPVDGPQWVDDMTATGIPFTPVYFAPDYIDAAEYIQYFGPVSSSNRGFGVPVPGATYDNDADVEAKLATALATSDDAARAALYTEIATTMIETSEVIALINPKTLFVVKSDLPVKYLSPCCILDLSRLGAS